MRCVGTIIRSVFNYVNVAVRVEEASTSGTDASVAKQNIFIGKSNLHIAGFQVASETCDVILDVDLGS